MDWLAEDPTEIEELHLPPWKVVIVDDDEQVHKVTEMTLKTFSFEQRKLEFIHLYSGEQTKEYFEKHNDIALVFLDVVMESDHAGLEVVKYIRETLGNHYTRIILRTGQPGSAPEEEVIRDYDIDGYKAKTKVTVNTLNHAIYIALRSYRDLVRIQNYQRGLEALIDSIANVTQIDNILELSNAVLEQMKSVLNAENTHFLVKETEAYSLIESDRHQWNLAVADSSAVFLEDQQASPKDIEVSKIAKRCFAQKDHVIVPPYYCHYYRSKKGTEAAFVLKCLGDITPMSLRLIKLFSINIILTIENLVINKDE